MMKLTLIAIGLLCIVGQFSVEGQNEPLCPSGETFDEKATNCENFCELYGQEPIKCKVQEISPACRCGFLRIRDRDTHECWTRCYCLYRQTTSGVSEVFRGIGRFFGF